jgi:hypothetical protein
MEREAREEGTDWARASGEGRLAVAGSTVYWIGRKRGENRVWLITC